MDYMTRRRRIWVTIMLASVWTLQVWIFPFNCNAVAIRIIPTEGPTEIVNPTLRVVVPGRRPLPLAATTVRSGSDGRSTGIADSKRRVPSCPDPLHNR